jgi:hypothetical protein
VAISPDGPITNDNEASVNATGKLHQELKGTAFSRDRARDVSAAGHLAEVALNVTAT